MLLVVACHARIPGFSGGFIGVDVFFVLSGNLITGLLLAEFRDTSRLNLPNFYARRARRLLPALLLVLLVTLSVGLVVQVPQELEFTARAARATALYISNVFFDYNAADYFAADVQSNPLLHTWSLGVEEQFYLFWPALVILGLRILRSPRALVALLSVATLTSLSLCIWATFRTPTVAFYELPARAWEFGFGALLAMTRLPRLAPLTWIISGWVGLAAILVPAMTIGDTSNFPGWLALLPAGGTVMVLAAGAAFPRQGVCALLNLRPMQYVGARSYSWYLWHWPFIVFAEAITPAIPWGYRALVAGASLAAAALTYRFVELPARHNPRLIARTWLSIRLAGAMAIAVAAIAWLVLPFSRSMAQDPAVAPIAAAVSDIADMPRSRCVSVEQETDALTCTFGDPQPAEAVVLFGDSHAIEWFNAILLASKQEHWRLITVLKSGCAASEIDDVTYAQTRLCRTWREKALHAIVGLRPALVFVASFSEWFGRASNRRYDPTLGNLIRGTKASLAQLSATGATVVLLRDTPYPPFDVTTCLERTTLHPWLRRDTCAFSRTEALNPRVFAAEEVAVASVSGAVLLDLSDQMCGSSRCPAMLGGIVVYRDENHLSGKFASTLAPALIVRLKAALTADREGVHRDQTD